MAGEARVRTRAHVLPAVGGARAARAAARLRAGRRALGAYGARHLEATAKQFMRRAAYEAGDAQPVQLVIALEPEAAAVYMRTLRLRDLLAGPLPLSAAAASLSSAYADSDLLLSLEQMRSGGVPLEAAAASHLRAQSLNAEQFAALVSRSNSTSLTGRGGERESRRPRLEKGREGVRPAAARRSGGGDSRPARARGDRD